MSKFEQLPNEILFKIFGNRSLSLENLISLSNVCKRFDHFCCSEEKLWELKFEQRWPLAWKKINSESVKSSQVENFKKEVEDLVYISERLEEILNSLSHHLYKFEGITSPISKSIFKLLNVGNLAPLIVLNDLLKIINCNSVVDLTMQYYAKEVLHLVNYHFWSEKLSKFFALQPESQSLEKAIFYLGKWFCPKDFFRTDYEEVSSKLDQLAYEVQLHLRTKNPTHPAATIKLLSPEEPLENSLWPDGMCSQIFACIKHIMFTKHKYETYDGIYDVFSNKILKRILWHKRYVSIIFKAISHRLGIHLDLLLIDHEYKEDEFLLEWKSPNSEIFEVMHPYYDIGWNNLSEEKQIQIRQKVCSTRRLLPNLAIETFNRSVDDESAKTYAAAEMILDIYSLLEDYCKLARCRVFEFCLNHRLHLEVIIEICEKLLKMSSIKEYERESFIDFSLYAKELLTIQQKGRKPIIPKHRRKGIEMKFAIGMLVYEETGYAPGVIAGWDEKYDLSEEKLYEFNLPSYDKCDEGRPHYFVLFRNGRVGYECQDYLLTEPEESPPAYLFIEPEESLPVKNDRVGKYFKAFNGKYYVPNEELRSEYPDDEKVIEELIQNFNVGNRYF